jgi:glycosyltransferase involved in cell wall biosynthesis
MQVLRVNNAEVHLKTLSAIKEFRPEIVHYVPGPTNLSVFFLKFVQLYLGSTPKIVLSAIHPLVNDIVFKATRFKPYCVFSPSISFKQRMERIGVRSELLLNGVDANKFAPVSESEKKRLRIKYGLRTDEFTILHVGHLIYNRSLHHLLSLPGSNQIVVVASEYIDVKEELLASLNAGGCTVFRGYFPHIEEFYQLADCYFFPVKNQKTLVCPLSIMEAMASNLPVVTAELESIAAFFGNVPGLLVAREDVDFAHHVEAVRNGEVAVKTRQGIQRYSWEHVAQQIAKVYLES